MEISRSKTYTILHEYTIDKVYEIIETYGALLDNKQLEKYNNSELKHFLNSKTSQVIVKWLFFCQIFLFYIEYFVSTYYNVFRKYVTFYEN